MKKIFTTFIAMLFVCFNLFSDPVNEKEAKLIAENFYHTYAPATKAGASVNQLITEKYQKTESFYIFGFDQGGFVIVSADDYAEPILGYSFTSPIEEKVGSNIRYLFDRYNSEIAEIKKMKSQNEDIKVDWEKLRSAKLSGEIKAAGPLLETTWNQSPVYNQYCPSENPVGCVATAMSQIMNYHQWPANGNGWHKYIPEDHPEYGIQYADFSSETYDWANMPNALSSSNSATEKDAVATLCYHAGVAVNMNYDPDGSGASSNDVLFALTSYFKYNTTSIELITYDKNNETEYLNKIKTEIDNNRPIYYDGQGDDGGHAWVCDGYNDDNKVHINWGWGGYYNGYFLLSEMSPGSYDFADVNAMIIGIQPGSAYQDIQWTKQASGFETASRGIRYISAVNERIAWAVAYDGSGDSADVKDFTKTTDGFNWVSGTINASDLDNYNSSMITAIDENNAWVALYGPNGGGKIVKTSDGGKSWTHQSTALFTAPNGFPNVVHFWNANNGWCQGDPNGGYFEFYTTTDGGTTWNRVPEGNIPASQSGEYGTIGYYAVYGDIVWFATNKGRIFKSIDKGYNWVVYQTPFSGTSFELSFRNENTGIIQQRSDGDDDNNIQYITNDGGETWTELTPTGNFYTNSFKYVPGENILISTGSDYETPFQGVSYSTDDGATFTEYSDFYQNFQFLTLGAASADAIWAGGYNSDENNDGMWHYGDILISAGFSSDDSLYCVSTDVLFTDNSYGTPESWNWDFGDGASPETETGIGPHTVTYSTSGYKNITLTINKGTDQQSLVKNKFIYIASSVPDDAGSITGENSVNAGETHTYSVTNQENLIFIWEIPTLWTGNSLTNEIEIEFTGTSSIGTITVTPSNACGEGATSSLEITVSPSTGINDLVKNNITIFPNPAKDNITITGIDNSEVRIYNGSGTLVKQIENLKNNAPINVSDLNAGLYYINIVKDNMTYTKTISIIK